MLAVRPKPGLEAWPVPAPGAGVRGAGDGMLAGP